MRWLRSAARAGAGWLILVLLLAGPAAVQAQVLDDSTKVLYGARTTFVLREADLLRDQAKGRIIDTTLTNLPSARTWYHDSTFHQDLGHVATAARPLLWRTNTELGARVGRNVFDRYARDPAAIPYYDSRSPYTFFRFIQGGNGEQVFELSYTRSINKNASVGIAYERFASNKVYATDSRERLVEHTNFLVFARFQSDDERYHALFNYSNVRHMAVEQGGIQPQPATATVPADTALSQLFDYGEERPRLFNANNIEHRDGLRLAQSYRLLGKGLTAYHVADWRRQMNKFNDTRLPIDAATNAIIFYPRARLSQTATDDRAEAHRVENTFGVLGRTSAVEYRLYARHRALSLATRNLVGEPGELRPAANDGQRFSQIFVGGTAAFNYRIFAIETAGEVFAQDFENPGANREYWVRGAAKLGPLTGELLSTSYSPTLTQRQFDGNHYAWENSFENTKVNQLTVRVNQTLGRHRLEASGAIVNITDLMYYSETGAPAQLSEDRRLLTLSARHRFNLGSFYFDNQAHATSGGDEEGLRIPALVTNSKFYYQGYLFKKVLFGQIGTEIYYQSTWRPYDYSPSNQQFYVQNHFKAANFAVADVFLTADIRTVAVLLKMAYVNQGILRDGYFVTPYYTGLPRRFELGIRWQFFD
ncbi:putative porin [Hymenobacter psychrotolerans]|uniref:putative porin n=1 Tax=Hymenobacter psychrotolerans TaxID=344998 RepID=UPI000B089C37|nr:putative porin [Hymenobacter psychrotolerans]